MNGGGSIIFFELFNEEGASENLWEMPKRALTSEEENTEGSERSNMIFLYEYKGIIQIYMFC